MQTETVQKLLTINRQFYQTFANEFDATRQRVQSGVARSLERVLDAIPPNARILDLGCGNGEVARGLARRGFLGEYVGVDFSEGLVQAARDRLPEDWSADMYRFEIRDLTAPDWDAGLEGSFDLELAFAVFHHLPPSFYSGILQKMRGLLTPPHPSTTDDKTGRSPLKLMSEDQNPPTPQLSQIFSPLPLFILSNWQFLNSPRWRARIQPWERVGLSATDVGLNDYLLDWRRGGEGLRYVHHFSQAELSALADEVGFEIVNTFSSDGAEGNLGLYQTWRPV